MTCSDPPTSAADEPRTSRDHLVEQLITANLRLFAAHRDSYGNWAADIDHYDLVPLLDDLVPLVEQLQAAPVPDTPRLDVIPVPPGSIVHLHNPDPNVDLGRVSRDIEARIGHDEFLIVATTGDSDLTVDQSVPVSLVADFLAERGPQVAKDCCLEVAFRAEPVLIVDDGEIDPFTGEEVGWPSPRIYWSNGVVTDGHAEEAT